MEEIIFKYFPDLTDKQKQQFAALDSLYREWNSKINVISRKDIDNFYIHHVLHSLAIAKEFSFESNMEVIDVGTGGGFPGIPLAILFPQTKFTLCDSIGKKIFVVQQVATSLGLQNVTAVQSRVEDLTCNYHYVVSRAVADLSQFMSYVKGKYSKGVIYLKGGDISQEISSYYDNSKTKQSYISIKEISDFFSEDYFYQKKIVFISR